LSARNRSPGLTAAGAVCFSSVAEVNVAAIVAS
jgi:hypothetical protein